MPELIVAIDAFVQEHRRCGELEGGVVWMTCECSAEIVHPFQKGLGSPQAGGRPN